MSAAFDQDAEARRYQPFPRSDFGRRQLAAFVRLHGGLTEEATRINWDLDPIRWAMRHEIEAAKRVARGLADATEMVE